MKIKYLCMLLLFAMSGSAFAGGSVGNGGNTVVCKDANGKVVSVALMDLWEGRNNASPNTLGGATLNIPSSNLPVDEQIDRALKRMDLGKDLEDYFREELAYIKTRFRPIPDNMGLTPVPEVMPLFEQDGCEFRLLANFFTIEEFNEASVIKFDSKLRALLDQDPTNEAALLVHETLYKMSRDFADASDSVLVRRIVALAFSDQGDLGWLKIFIDEALDLRSNPVVVLPSNPTQRLNIFLKYEAESSQLVRVQFKVTDQHEMYPQWSGCSLTPEDTEIVQCADMWGNSANDPFGTTVPLEGFLWGWPVKGMTVSVTLSGTKKSIDSYYTPSFGRAKLEAAFPGKWASSEMNFQKKTINFHFR